MGARQTPKTLPFIAPFTRPKFMRLFVLTSRAIFDTTRTVLPEKSAGLDPLRQIKRRAKIACRDFRHFGVGHLPVFRSTPSCRSEDRSNQSKNMGAVSKAVVVLEGRP